MEEVDEAAIHVSQLLHNIALSIEHNFPQVRFKLEWIWWIYIIAFIGRYKTDYQKIAASSTSSIIKLVSWDDVLCIVSQQY
jgi:hypothetical protein